MEEREIFFAATQKRAKQKEREIAVGCQYLGRRRLPRSAGHLAWSGEASKKKSFWITVHGFPCLESWETAIYMYLS